MSVIAWERFMRSKCSTQICGQRRATQPILGEALIGAKLSSSLILCEDRHHLDSRGGRTGDGSYSGVRRWSSLSSVKDASVGIPFAICFSRFSKHLRELHRVGVVHATSNRPTYFSKNKPDGGCFKDRLQSC